jgi:hypothetical protein
MDAAMPKSARELAERATAHWAISGAKAPGMCLGFIGKTRAFMFIRFDKAALFIAVRDGVDIPKRVDGFAQAGGRVEERPIWKRLPVWLDCSVFLELGGRLNVLGATKRLGVTEIRSTLIREMFFSSLFDRPVSNA